VERFNWSKVKGMKRVGVMEIWGRSDKRKEERVRCEGLIPCVGNDKEDKGWHGK
jgi:hypothetical protein